jgi:MFS family permease
MRRMSPEGHDLGERRAVPATDEAEAAPPTVLPARLRWRVFGWLGLLVALVAVGSPSGGLFQMALSLLLKNQMQLSASEVSTFLAVAAIPVYLSAVFGFVRDTWSPFGTGDRGHLVLFGSLTAALYLLLAFVPVTYATLLAAVLLLRAAFRLVSSAESGLVSALAQQHAMSGQVSALWNNVLFAVSSVSLLLGGVLGGLLEPVGGERAFHLLFLTCAAVVAGIVLYAWWRPRVVFGNVRDERRGRSRPVADLARLARHRPVYPAMLAWLLWSFAPGGETPLLYHLQRTLHATDAQWGAWNAIFTASFIPTSAAFGVLSTRVPLGRLLLWGTVVGIPQMAPLLFIRSVGGALVAAAAMGLMGGLATAAYTALVIRSCPPGLQGTVLMMSGALGVVAARLGDVLGTRLYEASGGFGACAVATMAVSALILPALLLVPRGLAASMDNEAKASAETASGADRQFDGT